MSQTPAGWLNDPYGRFQQRYWDGERWTEHVATGGRQQVDPLGASTIIPIVTPPTAFTEPAAADARAAAHGAPDAPDAPDAPEAASDTQHLLDSIPADERYADEVWQDEPGADL